MAIYSNTFGTLVIAIARATGIYERDGTATAGAAGTLTDTSLTDATDTAIKGCWCNIYDGIAQGDYRKITGFTAATDVVAVTPNFSATPTTATKYLLTRRYNLADIRSAIRQAVWEYGKYGKDWKDQSIIGQSPLRNGTFWDNSGTFPNAWTRTGTGGTFTQESTVAKHGRYACKMVSDGTNACGISQTTPNIGRYRNLGLIFKGWVFTNTASRVSISLADGITTNTETITTTNRGWGTVELETDSLTISDRASAITVTCDISAGSAVTAYFSGMWLPTGVVIDEHQIPAGSPTAIQRAVQENGVDGIFEDEYPLSSIEPLYESTRRLRFGSRRLESGRILELSGRQVWPDYSTLGTDEDTSFEGDSAWLINLAGYFLILPSEPELAERLRLRGMQLLRHAPGGAVLIERQ